MLNCMIAWPVSRSRRFSSLLFSNATFLSGAFIGAPLALRAVPPIEPPGRPKASDAPLGGTVRSAGGVDDGSYEPPGRPGGSCLVLQSQDFDADCVNVIVDIGLFARYANRSHGRMREQDPRNIVDQRFLQVNVPLFDAVADRQPNEIVIDHFMDPIMTGGRNRKWNEYVDVHCDALRAVFLVRVNADVGI